MVRERMSKRRYRPCWSTQQIWNVNVRQRSFAAYKARRDLLRDGLRAGVRVHVTSSHSRGHCGVGHRDDTCAGVVARSGRSDSGIVRAERSGPSLAIFGDGLVVRDGGCSRPGVCGSDCGMLLGARGSGSKATPAQSARVVRTEAIVRSDSAVEDSGLLLKTY